MISRLQALLLLPWLLAAASLSFGGDDPLQRRSTESGLSEATIQATTEVLAKEYEGYSGMGPLAQRSFAVMFQQTLTSQGNAALVHRVLQARSSSEASRPPGFQPLSSDEKLRFIRLLEADGSASYAQPLSPFLFDPDADVRAASAKALSAHTDPKLPQALDVLGALDLARSRETDAQVLRAIDVAMGAGPTESRLSEATIQETIKALVKEHPGLAGMGPKAQRAIAVMHHQTKHSKDDAALIHHVLQARSSSEASRPPGFQPLSQEERLRFIGLLESDGSASYVQPLSLYLFDPDPGVRVAAAKALSAHTDIRLPQAFDALRVLEWAGSKESDAKVQQAIYAAMAGVFDPQASAGAAATPQNPLPEAEGVLGRLRGLGDTPEAGK